MSKRIWLARTCLFEPLILHAINSELLIKIRLEFIDWFLLPHLFHVLSGLQCSIKLFIR